MAIQVSLKKDKTAAGIDAEAFERLFESYYEEIQHYIYYKCSDTDLTEDIAQETFLKIWEIRETIRPETVRALLYTIAGNLFVNKYKHNKVVMKMNHSVWSEQSFETPEFEMELKEFDQHLQRAISGLNEKNRVVFLMNRIDNMTYVEIAQNLGITVKAVEKRMKKALESLRSQIELKF